MVELILIIISYLGLTFWLTWEGGKRNIGYTRSFFASLLLTPLIGFVVVFNSQKRISYIVTQYKCSRCNFEFTEPSEFCPLCKKEGYEVNLKESKRQMT